MPDQTGKTIIVTGANVGIGYETALALYEKGATVIIACRDLAKAKIAKNRIEALNGSGIIEIGQLDLADLDSVRHFAKWVQEKHSQIDVLINNAGVMAPNPGLTAQGFELQFGVNFLGHFALTGLLYATLKATKGARIITITSMAYLLGVIDFDNLKSELSYQDHREYRRSKLADMIFSIELDRRIKAAGGEVLSIAAQPGANNTELIRHMDKEAIAEGVKRIGGLMEPSQGALPSLYAATMPDVKGGDFYEPEDGGYHGYPIMGIVKPHALDTEVAQKLWAVATEATGVNFPN